MSTEKPKRLVGWKQYIGNIAARVLGRFAVGTLLAGAFVCFGFNFFVFALWIGKAHHSAHPDFLLFGGLLGGVWLGSRSAKALLNRVEKIKPVGLITRHNTGNLPEVETLVRGSDPPATAEQAELLRAVRKSPESPPEQLLRAAQESRQDV
jgi:hypothetical protein